MRYDKIEEFVLSTEEDRRSFQVQARVIIHENRFTYEKKASQTWLTWVIYGKTNRVSDSFGCIIIRRSIDEGRNIEFNNSLKKVFNMQDMNIPVLSDFIKSNAREMEEKVMRQHIDLYVNEFSDEVGNDGQAAVEKFLRVHSSINKLEVNIPDIFLRKTV